jgi:predicted nucleotidyltransferase
MAKIMQAIETDKLQVEEIVRAFSDELVKRAGDEIEAIIWYGSTARGEGTPDSDIDVAVVLRNQENDRMRRLALDISAELSLDHDCLLVPFLISSARYQEMKQIGRLLVRNIEKDGVWIWQRPAWMKWMI